MLVLEDFEPLTIEEFQDLKLNAPTGKLMCAGNFTITTKIF